MYFVNKLLTSSVLPVSEVNGSIPFLDALIQRKEDGSVKVLVYRKKTHTDQYLNFTSHHPLQHKLGGIHTLYDRCENIVTETEDAAKEMEHIDQALGRCGYPKWSFEMVKKKKQEKKSKDVPKRDKPERTDRTPIMITLPYIKGVSDSLQRVCRSKVWGIHCLEAPPNTKTAPSPSQGQKRETG